MVDDVCFPSIVSEFIVQLSENKLYIKGYQTQMCSYLGNQLSWYTSLTSPDLDIPLIGTITNGGILYKFLVCTFNHI